MVQDYLAKCIESIVNQTYVNLEIILVDDGSQDNCGKICDEYSKRDERIKVIHKKNGGLSDARNAGIDVATGDYLLFVDSDDCIETQMVEFLIRPILEGEADVSVCCFRHVNEGQELGTKKYDYVAPKIISSFDDRTEYFFGDYYVYFNVAWNKLYPRKYFNELRFPKGKIHEDEFTTYILLEKAGRIAYFEIPLYNYLIRGNSIMGMGFKPQSLDKMEAYNQRIDHYLCNKNYLWAEKTLFLYRLLLIQATKKISTSKEYSMCLLDQSIKDYKKLVMRGILKFPISAKNKLGYLASALFTKKYIERRI